MCWLWGRQARPRMVPEAWYRGTCQWFLFIRIKSVMPNRFCLSCIFDMICICINKVLYEDPVISFDSNTQTVATSSGKTIKYGSLIISTGCGSARYSFSCQNLFFSTIFFLFFLNNLSAVQVIKVNSISGFQRKLVGIYQVFIIYVMQLMLMH